jgi:hypothetical protein
MDYELGAGYWVAGCQVLGCWITGTRLIGAIVINQRKEACQS